MMRVLVSGFALAALTLSVARADITPIPLSQAPNEIKRAVNVSAFVERNSIARDAKGLLRGELHIVAQVETLGPFHIFADRLSFEVAASSLVPGLMWNVSHKGPSTTQILDPLTRKLRASYHGQTELRVRAKLPDSGTSLTLPADFKLPLVVKLQACSEKICLLPVALLIETPLSYGGAAMSAAPAPPAALASSEDWLSRAQIFLQSQLRRDHLGLTTLILLLAGLLTALTPCVYPLYPITLGIFARWARAAHLSPFLLVLSYCSGLVLSYASIGAAAAASGQLFGSLTQTPGFLLGTGMLMLLMAVFFSGLLNFAMPQWLLNFFAGGNAANEQPQAPFKALLHAGFMGLGLGVVASPCVGPVLVTLLAWLGGEFGQQRAPWLHGLLALGVFGVGMCLPLLLLGYVTLTLHKQSSFGRFTPWAKNLGTLLIAASGLYFVSKGVNLQQSAQAVKTTNLPFYTYEQAPKNQWSVLDFRADWCAACLELEEKTFAVSPVRDELDAGRWQMIKIDLTDISADEQKLIDQHKAVGLPLVLLRDPTGKICENERLTGFEGAKDFHARMQRARKLCKE